MYKLGLIGYPIQHSSSPWIHRNLLEKAGVNGSYDLFEINPEDDFSEKVAQLKAKQLDGFNVTVPYKEKIIPYLDELDSVAEAMQAVNTVVLRNGKWIGYNTDGNGYLRSLKSAYPDFFQDLNKNILMIGAGGAARALYYALHEKGFQRIDIANRTLEKAEDIAKLGNTNSSTTIYSIEEASQRLHQYDLVIQTTSVGMKSIDPKPIVKIEQLKPEAIISDIVYQPIETEFLKSAKEHGARLLFGHTMLLYQAQAAFEIWTGKNIDVKLMENELLTMLEGR